MWLNPGADMFAGTVVTSPLVVLLVWPWPRSTFSPMNTIDPQTMAKIIQDRAAPCRTRIPHGGRGSTDDEIAVRSHGDGGGMAPGAPGEAAPAGGAGGGWGGGHCGGDGAAPVSAGGVATCSPDAG